MRLIPAPERLKLLAHEHRWRALQALSQSDLRVTELVALLEQPSNLVSYHLRLLRGHNLVRERRSSADGRDVYYTLNLDALRRLLAESGESLHPALGESEDGDATVARLRPGLRILFLCTHNSARSQMAEGLARAMSEGKIAAFSAGTEPSRVHPLAVRAMNAERIDIRAQRSKHLDEYLGQHFDYVITVCDRASESCPVFPGEPERIHWSIPDPSAVEGSNERRYRAFRNALLDLRTRIRYLLILLGRSTERPS
ncbi:MAG: metalloregulator ArsR/SmtB family transcription factor [Acidobacteriota bacterium]